MSEWATISVQLVTGFDVQGLEYVFSFVWKPPILIAWKPRADLDRDAMDPARDTVVSSLYKVSAHSLLVFL
jgi:hypothetical protein